MSSFLITFFLCGSFQIRHVYGVAFLLIITTLLLNGGSTLNGIIIQCKPPSLTVLWYALWEDRINAVTQSPKRQTFSPLRGEIKAALQVSSHSTAKNLWYVQSAAACSSFWFLPVGRCTILTALSVVLTCCPPAPLALFVSILRSFEFIVKEI